MVATLPQAGDSDTALVPPCVLRLDLLVRFWTGAVDSSDGAFVVVQVSRILLNQALQLVMLICNVLLSPY